MSRSFTHLRRGLLGTAVVTLGLGAMHLLAEPARASVGSCDPQSRRAQDFCHAGCTLAAYEGGYCDEQTWECVCYSILLPPVEA